MFISCSHDSSLLPKFTWRPRGPGPFILGSTDLQGFRALCPAFCTHRGKEWRMHAPRPGSNTCGFPIHRLHPQSIGLLKSWTPTSCQGAWEIHVTVPWRKGSVSVSTQESLPLDADEDSPQPVQHGDSSCNKQMSCWHLLSLLCVQFLFR